MAILFDIPDMKYHSFKYPDFSTPFFLLACAQAIRFSVVEEGLKLGRYRKCAEMRIPGHVDVDGRLF